MMKYSALLLLFLLGCKNASTEKVEAPPADTTAPAPLENLTETAPEQDTIVLLPPPDYDTSLWTELIRLDTSILLDLKYATEDNFVKEKMYDCGRCFLRPEVARAVWHIHRQLRTRGLGLKMYDCYRPRPVQRLLWAKVPDPRFVTDPGKGSMHNRGSAVDLTIVDSLGQELPMGTPFDYFGREAYWSYTQHPDSVMANRQLLKSLMEDNGFGSITTEWWHYNFRGKSYPLSDMLWKCYDERNY